MRRSRLAVGALVLSIAVVLCVAACDRTAPEGTSSLADLALLNGRVMDPESGVEAERHVGIKDGRIVAITTGPIEARETLDVGGLVVAPGFIDVNGHDAGDPDLQSRQLQARDGVTTSLELEAGAVDVAAWYAQREGRALLHYGVAASHAFARITVLGEERAPEAKASREEIEEIRRLVLRGLEQGALGVGFAIQYLPGTTREEVYDLVRLAAERNALTVAHVRSAGLVEPGGSVEAVQEMIANAAATGGAAHVVHIGSSGLSQVPVLLEMVQGAQDRGVRVTTDVYPYTAAATHIGAAIFDPGWRRRLAADYEDLEWAGTGERLTEASFHRRRSEEPWGMVVAHIIPEDAVDAAVAHPAVMIESDAVPVPAGPGHPRGAGTFARLLGLYAREKGIVSLMEALRKMTLMPARLLEQVVPEMSRKGRLAVGADADLTVFDPGAVIDRATFEDPRQPSAGIRHVLVAGTFVVRDSELRDVFPGQPIRRPRQQ